MAEMFPDEDIFVPSPPIKIPEGLLERYVSLYKGLRSRVNPISWRSFITETKVLLGSPIPDKLPLEKSMYHQSQKLLKFLLTDTYLEKLYSEALFALGFESKAPKEKLDLLIVNAHHTSEPLFWNMIDEAKKKKLNFAAINPVGHYNDQQIRILSPQGIHFTAKRIVIITSTQSINGGGLTLLLNVIRIIRNRDLVRDTKNVDIIIPMFGGSRGHKISQLPEIGYEVLEMINNPKILCLVTQDIQERLRLEGVNPPEIKYYSVDIHNSILPGHIFNKYKCPFINILPAKEMADEFVNVLKEKRLKKLPLYITACDEGAVRRAEAFIDALLHQKALHIEKVHVIDIEKVRKEAGQIASAKISAIYSYRLNNGKITTRALKIPKISYQSYVLLYIDDMIDTGGTAKKDMEVILAKFPNPRIKIFSATHPILSKGFAPLDTIGVDLFLIGNTLKVPGITQIPKVRVVNLAKSIYEAIK